MSMQAWGLLTITASRPLHFLGHVLLNLILEAVLYISHIVRFLARTRYANPMKIYQGSREAFARLSGLVPYNLQEVVVVPDTWISLHYSPTIKHSVVKDACLCPPREKRGRCSLGVCALTRDVESPHVLHHKAVPWK